MDQYQANNPEVYKASNRISVDQYQANNLEKYQESHLTAVKKSQLKKELQFPPASLNKNLEYKIISNFCKDTAPDKFQEAGCAVCGKLTLFEDLKLLSNLSLNLNILQQSGVTQKERHFSQDPIQDIQGPIIEKSLNSICKTCTKSLDKGKIPLVAEGHCFAWHIRVLLLTVFVSCMKV